MKFTKEFNEACRRRGEMFRRFPVSDWHQIIAFERIVNNYMKMLRILEQDKIKKDEEAKNAT